MKNIIDKYFDGCHKNLIIEYIVNQTRIKNEVDIIDFMNYIMTVIGHTVDINHVYAIIESLKQK